MKPHNATDFWNDESLQTVNKTCFSGFPNIHTNHLNRIKPLNYATETGTRNAKGRGDVTQLRHADPTQCCQLFCHNEQVHAWNLVNKVHPRISRADLIQPPPSHHSFTTHFSINLATPQFCHHPLGPLCIRKSYVFTVRLMQTPKQTACAKCKVS
jgi:hypothetical protein